MEREVYRIERVFNSADKIEDEEWYFKFLIYGEALIYATSMWQLYDKIVSFYDAFYDDETYRNAIDVFICDFDNGTSEFNRFQKKIVDIRAERRKEQLEALRDVAKELPF